MSTLLNKPIQLICQPEVGRWSKYGKKWSTQFLNSPLLTNYIHIHKYLWCSYKEVVQWCALENQQNPFYVVNEVTLRGQNPSLKFCQPLELLTQFIKDLDLSMLKIWGLQVKGLQSYWPSNFENDLTLVQLKSGQIGSTRAGAVGKLCHETSNFESQ